MQYEEDVIGNDKWYLVSFLSVLNCYLVPMVRRAVVWKAHTLLAPVYFP